VECASVEVPEVLSAAVRAEPGGSGGVAAGVAGAALCVADEGVVFALGGAVFG
jgi:hypothetical protein